MFSVWTPAKALALSYIDYWNDFLLLMLLLLSHKYLADKNTGFLFGGKIWPKFTPRITSRKVNGETLLIDCRTVGMCDLQ